MSQTQYLLHRSRRQRRLAAAPLRDHAYSGCAFGLESGTPTTHCIGIDLAPTRDLSVGKPISGQQQAAGLDNDPVGPAR